MKLQIAANNKINSVSTTKNDNGDVVGIEIDFEKSIPWSDLEFWLRNSEATTNLDYAKMNISKRNKMKFSK